MTLLSRRCALAVAAVLDVAQHARPAPVSSGALAARLSLPPRHLEGLLQTLVRKGLLKGTRGPGGGYALARERRRLSIGDILRAVEADAGPADTPPTVPERLRERLEPLERAFRAELDTITIDMIVPRSERAPTRTLLHDVGL